MKNAQNDKSHMNGVRAVNRPLMNKPMVVTVLPPYNSDNRPAGMVPTNEPQKNAPINQPFSESVHSYCGPYYRSDSKLNGIYSN